MYTLGVGQTPVQSSCSLLQSQWRYIAFSDSLANASSDHCQSVAEAMQNGDAMIWRFDPFLLA